MSEPHIGLDPKQRSTEKQQYAINRQMFRLYGDKINDNYTQAQIMSIELEEMGMSVKEPKTVTELSRSEASMLIDHFSKLISLDEERI